MVSDMTFKVHRTEPNEMKFNSSLSSCGIRVFTIWIKAEPKTIRIRRILRNVAPFGVHIMVRRRLWGSSSSYEGELQRRPKRHIFTELILELPGSIQWWLIDPVPTFEGESSSLGLQWIDDELRAERRSTLHEYRKDHFINYSLTCKTPLLWWPIIILFVPVVH